MDMHINNILKDLEKDNFQAYLITQFTNVKYISGYKPTSFAFCILKENPVIYASGMDMELANRDSTIEVKKYESYEIMIDELKREGVKNLAIEPSLPFSTYVRFRDDFEIDSKTYIDKQRMIKTPHEIEKITEATEIAQKSFLQLDTLNNSATEKEVAFDLVRLMIENGASKESFDTIVTSGADSSLPHAIPQAKKLDQPILIDWGAIYDGYCSDNTRTMVYTERQQEIWDIVAEAHDKAIQAIRPGLKCCEIDKVARDIIEDYGYGDKFIHSTGHSLGLDIHETPGFSLRDDTIIEEGMVITVEPGIYLEGEFGVRLEDTVSISKRANVIGNLPLNID
ncbi:MAG: aminopeptidase P family protein [Methanobrevibacter sp.]|uniref:aminopeptidase P family protein n=1 Tax=Methanobrevibacter sp. TaxID=66852 RepID=UPI0025F70355|nr:aminopeptidase P family protein [Methanobrevibacter sp.]MBR3112774.1 aminopeptidase P family protein [Methanobrevibacter sp.]MBR6992649.1 aminopeptidase P family protein [Methanobrevibacter sp.]